MVHLSAFAHQPRKDRFEDLDAALAELDVLGLENPVELGRAKLISFLGYIALGNPATRFVVYSRGFFAQQEAGSRWITEVEARFPELRDRISVFDVPGDVTSATFQDPETGDQVRLLVRSILGVN